MATVSNAVPWDLEGTAFAIPLSTERTAKTDKGPGPKSDNLIVAPSASKTDATPAVGVRIAYPDAADPQAQPAQAVDAAAGARGVVLSFNDASVRCEFLHGQPTQVVWLPRALFPPDVEEGYPFTFLLAEEDGLRTPKILPRAPTPSPELDARVADLLARFRRS